jgi:hypothetical protein
VVKREFAKAELLAKHAVCLAREVYGPHHAKYADCLVDLGFYLLNIDCIGPSMQVSCSRSSDRKNLSNL